MNKSLSTTFSILHLKNIPEIIFIIVIVVCIFLVLAGIILLILGYTQRIAAIHGAKVLKEELEYEKGMVNNSIITQPKKEEIAIYQLSNYYFFKSIHDSKLFLAKKIVKWSLLLIVVAILIFIIFMVLWYLYTIKVINF